MKILLEELLPRIFPSWVQNQHFICIPHEGKSDLEASIPRKLRGWREPGVRFVVMRDNDGANCVDLKARYTRLCQEAGRPDSLVRIVCQELESWYLGDLRAVAEAFGVHVNTTQMARRFSNPDEFNNASQELKRLVPRYQKLGGARAIGPCLNPEINASTSFRSFVSGVKRIASVIHEPLQAP